MRRFLIPMIFSSAALLLTPAARATAEEKDKDEVGIKVGEKAPHFKLKAQHGKEIELKELLKKGNVALVFYRSAEW